MAKALEEDKKREAAEKMYEKLKVRKIRHITVQSVSKVSNSDIPPIYKFICSIEHLLFRSLAREHCP